MRKRVKGLILLAIAGAAIGGLLFLSKSLTHKKPPPNIIWGSGIVEGDEVEVSPKIPGKVARLLVKEGDQVALGAPIALLDSQEIQARVKAAQAQVTRLRREVDRARVALKLTREVVGKKIQEARAMVKGAQARLRGAKAQWEKWEKDWKRFRALRERKVISQRRLDEVAAAAKSAKAQMESAQQELNRARAALETALAKKREITLRQKEIGVLESALATTQAKLEEAQALLEDTRIPSPVKGRVVEKLVEEGEVVTAGTPLVIVTNLDSLYLKIYIPEPQMGRIALGQEARIYVDAFPDTPFPAQVCYVASKAEFTPKEVQTHKERVQYTFAVKLCVKENRDHLLKPGMPGDGVIKVEPGPWWNPIREETVQ
ncbi:MAG: hypothetical protein DRI93_01420 [Aquificota bacterium]|nr:MAG: hypothetical protein DRI93_01420 [Aquificota bacterium]